MKFTEPFVVYFHLCLPQFPKNMLSDVSHQFRSKRDVRYGTEQAPVSAAAPGIYFPSTCMAIIIHLRAEYVRRYLLTLISENTRDTGGHNAISLCIGDFRGTHALCRAHYTVLLNLSLFDAQSNSHLPRLAYILL